MPFWRLEKSEIGLLNNSYKMAGEHIHGKPTYSREVVSNNFKLILLLMFLILQEK